MKIPDGILKDIVLVADVMNLAAQISELDVKELSRVLKDGENPGGVLGNAPILGGQGNEINDRTKRSIAILIFAANELKGTVPDLDRIRKSTEDFMRKVPESVREETESLAKKLVSEKDVSVSGPHHLGRKLKLDGNEPPLIKRILDNEGVWLCADSRKRDGIVVLVSRDGKITALRGGDAPLDPARFYSEVKFLGPFLPEDVLD